MDSTMSSNSVEISYENTFFLGERKKGGRLLGTSIGYLRSSIG